MILMPRTKGRRSLVGYVGKGALAALALSLAACTSDEDSTVGSHLSQPPPNSPPRKPVESGDIAIVGQNVAHAIMDLPAISSATVPPMVQFGGVTSIVVPPIDTEPYTELFRDRLILLTREKLRFQERTLPMLVTGKKAKHAASSTPETSDEPEYKVLAEMRGHADDDTYRIQVQFVDLRTNDILLDELYRISKEDGGSQESAPSEQSSAPMAPPSMPSAPPVQQQPAPQPSDSAPQPAAPTTPTL